MPRLSAGCGGNHSLCPCKRNCQQTCCGVRTISRHSAHAPQRRSPVNSKVSVLPMRSPGRSAPLQTWYHRLQFAPIPLGTSPESLVRFVTCCWVATCHPRGNRITSQRSLLSAAAETFRKCYVFSVAVVADDSCGVSVCFRHLADRHRRRRGQDANPAAHPRWRVILPEVRGPLLLHRLPHPFRDDSRIVVHCNITMRSTPCGPRDEYAETASEWVGYPPFMRPRRVPAASDHGRLNALTSSAWNALDVEDRERHTGYCSGRGRLGCAEP